LVIAAASEAIEPLSARTTAVCSSKLWRD